MNRDIRIFRDWFFLFAYLTAIFVIFPFSEYAVRRTAERNPAFGPAVTVSAYLYIGIVGAALAVYAMAADKNFKLLRLSALALILATAMYGVSSLKNTYDKLHIIEYSILTFFLFRVLRFYNTTTALYLWCVIFTAIAGLADESIQRLIPGRTCSLQDFRTDIFSGILTGLSIMLVICPKLEKWRLKMDFYKKELYRRQKWVDDYRLKRGVFKKG